MTSNPIRTAIVTGASKGIGAAIARRLARDGFAVVVNYARGRAEAEAVVGTIEAEGGKAIAVQADIADPTGIATLFDAGEKVFGGVDILVNNAGIMHQPRQVDSPELSTRLGPPPLLIFQDTRLSDRASASPDRSAFPAVRYRLGAVPVARLKALLKALSEV